MTVPSLDLDRVVAHSFVAGVEHYALIDSTNNRAKEAAAAPTELPLLVVADSQTAGRGRGVNRWWTGQGSLAFSLVVDPAVWHVDSRRHAPALSLAVANTVAETANMVLPEEMHANVKPPNDVYVGDRKLAGILIEGLASGLLVIGIGLNTNNTLANAPSELRTTVTTLRELLGRPVDPTELLLEMLARLEAALTSVGTA